MSKKIIFLTFLTLVFITSGLIFFKKEVKAEGSPAYAWQCMEVVAKYDDCHSTDTNCASYPAGTAHPDPANKDHEVKIGGTGFPTGVDIYLVACLTTDTFTKCTTGDPASDGLLGIEKKAGHVFKILGSNPRKAEANGNLSAIVRSYYPDKVRHKFFGVYPGVLTGAGGEASTITYGTFDFTSANKKCFGIKWDPEGRVFDSRSLEPVENATVTLLDETKAKAKLTIDTKVNTSKDGGFSFYTPAGSYYFDPAKTGYRFPVAINKLHPNYSKAYYCDQDENNQYDYPIYDKQYKIVEQNKLLHCDIPLDPGSNPPLHKDPEILTFGQMAVPGTLSTQFEGTVTHPFTRILLIGEKTGKEYVRIDADKFGNFIKVVDNSLLPQDEGLRDPLADPQPVVKFDLTTGQYLSQKENLLKRLKKLVLAIFPINVSAQTTKYITRAYAMEPILRYLEGYAYNTQGQAIPFATVSIKLQMSGKTVYQTTADKDGFFRIAPQNLPIFEYYVEFTPPNSSIPVKMTTSEFSQKNKNYLAENKINLMTVTEGGKPISRVIVEPSVSVSPQVTVSTAPGFIGNQFGGLGNQPGATAQPNVNKTFILYVVVILVSLIVLVFIGILFYLKKKKEQENYLA